MLSFLEHFVASLAQLKLLIKAQARSPVIVYPTAHNTDKNVTSHACDMGRDSRKFVASKM